MAGAVGCVLPVLPGHLIILMAAVAHRLMLGADGSGLEWWSFVVLVALLAISQTLEVLSGAAGTRWFGGTRWGAFGALAGGIAGIFFMPFGLLVGPLLGAFICEIAFAKKETRPAVISGGIRSRRGSIPTQRMDCFSPRAASRRSKNGAWFVI